MVTEEELANIDRALKEDVALEKGKSKSVFADATSSLLKATLLFYLNSGCSRFSEWKHFSCAHKDKPLDTAALQEEILDEKLT